MKTFAIPARRNLFVASAQLIAMLSLLGAAGQVTPWWAGALLALGYAMRHEAEHGILHPHRGLNDAVGTVLALFFPAPFHLIRQGHIGHHIRNRSDDEAFDLYFENASRFWKCGQLYGTRYAAARFVEADADMIDFSHWLVALPQEAAREPQPTNQPALV
jgi:fatty acid desaturase